MLVALWPYKLVEDPTTNRWVEQALEARMKTHQRSRPTKRIRTGRRAVAGRVTMELNKRLILLVSYASDLDARVASQVSRSPIVHENIQPSRPWDIEHSIQKGLLPISIYKTLLQLTIRCLLPKPSSSGPRCRTLFGPPNTLAPSPLDRQLAVETHFTSKSKDNLHGAADDATFDCQRTEM